MDFFHSKHLCKFCFEVLQLIVLHIVISFSVIRLWTFSFSYGSWSQEMFQEIYVDSEKIKGNLQNLKSVEFSECYP